MKSSQTKTTQWRDVPGYEGHYLVSDSGLVHSTLRGRLLKTWPDRDGYLVTGLSHAGKQKFLKVHALVLMAFVGPRPFDGAQARHLDGNSQNNHLSNLCWGTASQNVRDAVQHGTQRNVRKTRCPQGHEYTPENTYTPPSGSRQCRTCRRVHQRRWARQRAAQRTD